MPSVPQFPEFNSEESKKSFCFLPQVVTDLVPGSNYSLTASASTAEGEGPAAVKHVFCSTKNDGSNESAQSFPSKKEKKSFFSPFPSCPGEGDPAERLLRRRSVVARIEEDQALYSVQTVNLKINIVFYLSKLGKPFCAVSALAPPAPAWRPSARTCRPPPPTQSSGDSRRGSSTRFETKLIFF